MRSETCTASELLVRSRAEAAVGAIAKQIGAQLTPEWEYAKLTVGDLCFTVGASTGGVVSVNGDPFTMEGRQLAITPESILESIQARVKRALQTPQFYLQ